MSKRLSDDEKRYFTDQISMLKGENERLTKYVEDLQTENGALLKDIQAWRRVRGELKTENKALRDGIQEVRNIAGTEWGRCEKDSPWGKALFWIMQKCEALLTG